VLTGILLICVIAYEKIFRQAVFAKPADPGNIAEGYAVTSDIQVKNSQNAFLCASVLAAGLIVAGTNVWLVRSPRPEAATVPSGKAHLVIAMMPKAKGDPYFVSAKAGAEEAARELGVDLLWDGPATLDAAKQNELVENWITRRVDAIAVAVENKGSISTVLRKARGRGIRVLTWDADAEPDARDYFVNQATPEGIAKTLTQEVARLLNKQGEFAIITGALTAANQNEWIRFVRRELSERYPAMKLAAIRPSDDDRDKAYLETQTLLRAYPNVKLVMAISAPAVPGAAEAVRQASRRDVPVIGLSLPSSCKPYIKDGVVPSIVLWSTRDLGYLTVYSSVLAVRGDLQSGAASVSAGRLGQRAIRGTEVILGEPIIINRANIDQFDF
jgi:rhamnose transport system permease protein